MQFKWNRGSWECDNHIRVYKETKAGAEYLLLDSGAQRHACPIKYQVQQVPLLDPGIHTASGARLREPGTPDQIVMEQHSLTDFPSQPWCKMCVESRGRDSPHREQSKIRAVVPQLQFDYGYMGDGGPLQIATTRRWCPTPRRWTCLVLLPQQPSRCVTWGMNAFVHIETKNEFFSC